MGIHSRVSWLLRILAIGAGITVFFVGFGARSFEDHDTQSRIHGGEGQLEDGTWVAWQVTDSSTTYEVSSIGNTTFVVYAIPVDSDTRTEVFRGTEDEANDFSVATTRVVAFEGARQELDAWISERYDATVNMAIPNVIIAVGVLLIVVGVVAGLPHDDLTDRDRTFSERENRRRSLTSRPELDERYLIW